MFEFHHIIFACAYLIGVSQYVIKGRRLMMTVRTISSLLWTFYFCWMSAYAGAAACMIAALGSFVQCAVPDHLLARTLKPRIAAALLLAVTSAFFCARSASDLLPLTAVAIGRFVEIQSCQQRIRVGLMVCQLMWITYYWQQGYLVLYCAENMTLVINCASSWIQEQKRKKTAAAPAVAPASVTATA